MTSRRSFLKALALAAGGATIASKAVSAILTRPEHKNALADVGNTQNGHPDYEACSRYINDRLPNKDVAKVVIEAREDGWDVHTFCKEEDGTVTHYEMRERIWNLHKDLPPYTEEELMRP